MAMELAPQFTTRFRWLQPILLLYPISFSFKADLRINHLPMQNTSYLVFSLHFRVRLGYPLHTSASGYPAHQWQLHAINYSS
jgi:hypothetical protein